MSYYMPKTHGVTIRRSEKSGRSAKLMARPLAHSCPLARHFGGLREVSDIEEGKRRLVEGKRVSRSLRECHELTGRGRRFNVSRSKARYYLGHAVGVDTREAWPEKSVSRRTET